MKWRTLSAAAAAAALTALAGAAPAQAQAYAYYGDYPAPAYGYYEAAPPPYEYGRRYGPADPCAREAGNRALGWGLAGLLLGGLAGGAAAGAGVVAEGAALGGFLGGVTGAVAGSSSAACGTARYSGQPIYGTTSRGVAVYAPPRPMYDYGAAYPPPHERRAYRNHHRGRYDDCCERYGHSYDRYAYSAHGRYGDGYDHRYGEYERRHDGGRYYEEHRYHDDSRYDDRYDDRYHDRYDDDRGYPDPAYHAPPPDERAPRN